MKLLATLSFLLLVVISSSGQTATPKPNAEQDKQIKAAVETLQRATKDLAEAQTRAQNAQLQLQSSVYKVMAEMGLKPSEWNPTFAQDGALSFEPVKKAAADPKEVKKNP